MPIEHIEAVASTSTKTTIGGASGAVLFGLTGTEIGAYCAVVSTIVTIIGVCFKIYFDYQAYKLRVKKDEN